MKVKELIDILSHMPDDADVIIDDPRNDIYEDVAKVVYLKPEAMEVIVSGYIIDDIMGNLVLLRTE